MKKTVLAHLALSVTVAVSVTCLPRVAIGQSITKSLEGGVEEGSSINLVGWWQKRCCNPCDSCSQCPSAVSAAQPSPIEPAPEGQAPSEPSFDLASATAPAAAAPALAPGMIGDSVHSLLEGRVISRYKMADNESPIPRNRVFGSFHHFGDAYLSGLDLNRSIFGVERTFMDGMCSFELRSSLASVQNENRTDFGNLVTTFKGLLYQDCQTALAAGVSMQWVVDPPAGYPRGNHIVSPYIGYVLTNASGRTFLQGFEQLDVPFDSDDQLLLHSDIGVGHWLYRDPCRTISGIAPMVELHLYTPVGGNPSGDLLGLDLQDALNLTLGVVFAVGDSANVTAAFNPPLSDKDYDYEAQIQFNWFYGSAGRYPYGRWLR